MIYGTRETAQISTTNAPVCMRALNGPFFYTPELAGARSTARCLGQRDAGGVNHRLSFAPRFRCQAATRPCLIQTGEGGP